MDEESSIGFLPLDNLVEVMKCLGLRLFMDSRDLTKKAL
jgi:hypothetical protein